MINIDDFLKASELNDFDKNFSLIKHVSNKIDEPEARKIIIHILYLTKIKSSDII